MPDRVVPVSGTERGHEGDERLTPAGLIEMLSRWKPDEPFEVLVQNNPWGDPEPIVVLAQGTNTINLASGPDVSR